MSKKKKIKPGHIEIIGETIAKFELFEQDWNPYSRFLDIDNDLKVVGLAYSFNYYFWVKKKRNVIRE